MAMDKDRLGDAIITAINNLNGNMLPEHATLMRPFWRAIANEIILEIRNNIQITTEVPNIESGPDTATGTNVSVQ